MLLTTYIYIHVAVFCIRVLFIESTLKLFSMPVEKRLLLKMGVGALDSGAFISIDDCVYTNRRNNATSARTLVLRRTCRWFIV